MINLQYLQCTVRGVLRDQTRGKCAFEHDPTVFADHPKEFLKSVVGFVCSPWFESFS